MCVCVAIYIIIPLKSTLLDPPCVNVNWLVSFFHTGMIKCDCEVGTACTGKLHVNYIPMVQPFHTAFETLNPMRVFS